MKDLFWHLLYVCKYTGCDPRCSELLRAYDSGEGEHRTDPPLRCFEKRDPKGSSLHGVSNDEFNNMDGPSFFFHCRRENLFRNRS